VRGEEWCGGSAGSKWEEVFSQKKERYGVESTLGERPEGGDPKKKSSSTRRGPRSVGIEKGQERARVKPHFSIVKEGESGCKKNDVLVARGLI